VLRICLILVATLGAGAASAASIQPAPETASAMSPSLQQVGGAASPSIAEVGAIDRLETASTDGEPMVVSASAFVQTSPSIFQMIPETGQGPAVARRNAGSPRVIRAGAIGGSASTPDSAAASSSVEEAPVEEIEDMDAIDEMDGNAAYDEPAAAPTDTPR
jgi:hypothetical protein